MTQNFAALIPSVLLSLILTIIVRFIFNTFCAHKIVALKDGPLKRRRKNISRALFFISITPIVIILFLATKDVSYACTPVFFLILAVVSHLFKTSLKDKIGFLAYWLIILVAFPLYRKVTIGTVLTDFMDYVYIGLASVVQAFTLMITIRIYESFIQDKTKDPDLNWSNFTK